MSRSNVKAILSIASVLVLAPFVVSGPARPEVVTVRVWTGAGTPERATGTVVAPGRVLTVAHVLEGRTRVRAGERAATVVWRDAARDLALLRVAGVTGPAVRFGEADGELRVLTSRGAIDARVRRRITARLVDQPGKPRRPSFELAATVAAGDSGAPVVDADGEIVGIVYARSTRHGGTAYATRMQGVLQPSVPTGQ